VSLLSALAAEEGVELAGQGSVAGARAVDVVEARVRSTGMPGRWSPGRWAVLQRFSWLVSGLGCAVRG
jgi:hypothetical protein